MKRLIAMFLASIVALTMFAPAAHADGQCYSTPFKPRTVSGGQVRFEGSFVCTLVHEHMHLTVWAGKRNGNDTGAFNWFDLTFNGTEPDDSKQISLDRAFDCNKDYRVRVDTFANNPDNVVHGVDNKVGNILQSTC